MKDVLPWALWTGAAFCATYVIVGAWAAANAELYFPLYPAIDTEFAAGYQEAHFDLLEPGMTRGKVVALIGAPLQTFEVRKEWHPFLRPGAVQGWSYSDDGACAWAGVRWCDFAWLGRYVYFDQYGRITEVDQVVHHD
jgi:hypothetical protein